MGAGGLVLEKAPPLTPVRGGGTNSVSDGGEKNSVGKLANSL